VTVFYPREITDEGGGTAAAIKDRASQELTTE
jgi:hypothetical protein